MGVRDIRDLDVCESDKQGRSVIGALQDTSRQGKQRMCEKCYHQLVFSKLKTSCTLLNVLIEKDPSIVRSFANYPSFHVHV